MTPPVSYSRTRQWARGVEVLVSKVANKLRAAKSCRRYYLAHKKEVNKYHRDYYRAHKEDRKKYNHRYYLKTKNLSSARSRAWYEKNKVKALKYRRTHYLANRKEILRKCKIYVQKNLSWISPRVAEAKRKMKLSVKMHLGGRCRCCGEREPEFLTIDHIHGGGSKVRNKQGFRKNEVYYYEIYRAMKAGRSVSKKYQLLCSNCNLSKHLGGGVCAHKRKASSLKKVED